VAGVKKSKEQTGKWRTKERAVGKVIREKDIHVEP